MGSDGSRKSGSTLAVARPGRTTASAGQRRRAHPDTASHLRPASPPGAGPYGPRTPVHRLCLRTQIDMPVIEILRHIRYMQMPISGWCHTAPAYLVSCPVVFSTPFAPFLRLRTPFRCCCPAVHLVKERTLVNACLISGLLYHDMI